MKKEKTNIFKKFYNWFLNVNIYQNQENLTNKQFYLFFSLKSLAIFLSLFLSFVFPTLNFLPLVVTSVVILSENSFNRLYYFALITPFWFVFDYIAYVYSLLSCLWIIKILRDGLKKEIKFSIKWMVVAAILLIYCILALKHSWSGYWFVIRVFSLLLFLFIY